MTTDTVAIKMADGSFKPLINIMTRSKKRVVLSMASHWQEEIELDFYHGIGKELFDQSLLDTIVIEDIPHNLKGDLDIALYLSVDDTRTLDIHITVEGSTISMGRTYSFKQLEAPVDIQQYTIDSSHNAIDAPRIEHVNPAKPIDEDFVLGIDPYISYDKDVIRREEWQKTKKKINKGMRISFFAICIITAIGIICLLSFLVYLGIRIPAIPPLQA